MNINASGMNIFSSSYNFTTTAKSSTEETSNEEELTSVQASTTSIGSNQSQDGDSVSISEAALSALENDEEEETSTADVLASAAQDATSDSSNDLSSYTESQLKDMVNSGEISQSQYNAEIASRTADEESVDENKTQTEQAATNGVEKAMMAQMHIDISL